MFTISAAGRSFLGDFRSTNIFFAIWVGVSFLLYHGGLIDHVTAINIALGAGLSGYFLFYMLHKDIETNSIFAFLLLYNLLFITARQYFYGEYISQVYDNATNDIQKAITERYANNPDQASLFTEMLIVSKQNYTTYIVGLWTALMMFCLSVAYFVSFSRISDIVGIHHFQNHVLCIYSLIVALVILVFTKYDTFAKNYIIAISPLYIMQGLGVLGMKSQSWAFRISPILKILVFLFLLLNPYFWLIIALVGIFDCWLDFRKINIT